MIKAYMRRNSLVLREVAGQALLIPVSGEMANLQRVFALNPVAKCVWTNLAVCQGAPQLLDAVISAFDVGEAEARRDLDALLAEMLEAGLIETSEQET